MTDSQGVTAASVPPPGTGAVPEQGTPPEKASPPQAQAQLQAQDPPQAPAMPEPEKAEPERAEPQKAGAEPEDAGAEEAEAEAEKAEPEEAGAEPEEAEAAEVHARVDGRKLESALLALRHPIVEVPLRLEAPGAPEARAERRKLLSQIDDYLLPRLRQSGAPMLVAVVGSTGAGKSTLINSLVGKRVSITGTRRPTTNSPVLACHTGDGRWFAENVFLPTLPRVRQQGLAMPGRDGLLVLAESDGVPEGVALLDTPDIDSVVEAHREFAHQFLDASDLWLFMTSASRYADAAVWQLLQQAKERDASLAIVLSRVPKASERQLTAHFDSMLEANGLGRAKRFAITETVLTDGMLPAEIYGPVRQWLEETAARKERRIAVLTRTMSGILDTFRTRVPALADHVERQLSLRSELLSAVDACYVRRLAEFDEAIKNGSLLHGEVLARWQDFAGAGELQRMLQVRRGARPGATSRRRRIPAARAMALKAAVRAGLEALITSLADRSAEDAVARWQQQEAGAALLASLNAGDPAGQPGGPATDLAAGLDFIPSSASQAPAPSAPDATALARSSPDLATRVTRTISAWQEHVRQMVQAENVTKRSVARVVSFDEESLALVLTIGLLGESAGDTEAADAADDGAKQDAAGENAGSVPQRLLMSLLGAGPLRTLTASAREDLHERVRLLFVEDMYRFTQVVNAAGAPSDTAAVQLHQASYELEAAR